MDNLLIEKSDWPRNSIWGEVRIKTGPERCQLRGDGGTWGWCDNDFEDLRWLSFAPTGLSMQFPKVSTISRFCSFDSMYHGRNPYHRKKTWSWLWFHSTFGTFLGQYVVIERFGFEILWKIINVELWYFHFSETQMKTVFTFSSCTRL